MSLTQISGPVTETDWEKYRETIRILYLTENRRLEGPDGVMDAMKTQHNFEQSYVRRPDFHVTTLLRLLRKGQYERHFRLWSFKKNSTQATWKAIAKEVRKRQLDGKDSEIYLDGALVPPKKRKKQLQRYSNICSPPSSTQCKLLSPRAGLL
jgi:hypothetical protein